MPSPLHVVVVNGYGCHLTPELREYLDGVVQYVVRHKPDCIILCGGATQRMSAPGVTEAKLMARYINEHVHMEHMPYLYLILEVYSYTTLENVLNASSRLRQMLSGTDTQDIRIVVFCEAQRALKTLILYWIQLPELRRCGHRIKLMTTSWELENPFRELWSIVCDVAACYVPGLLEYARWRRFARSKTI